MSRRVLITVVLVIIVISVVAGLYLYYLHIRSSKTIRKLNTTSVKVSSNIASICNSIGNMSIGQTIRWLFNHHNYFRFKRYEFPDNFTIIWIITAPSHSMLSVLVSHIRQMECIIEHGGNPRPWDPVFRVDAYITRRYVKTEIVWLNSTAIKVIKIADNKCAYEVIKLHAEIVEGFFKTGRVEAQKIHNVPESVLKICKPYLNQILT